MAVACDFYSVLLDNLPDCFFGGWKLFESNDPILMEIGAALVLSIFFFANHEVLTMHEKKIKDLEERIQKLEDTIAKR